MLIQQYQQLKNECNILIQGIKNGTIVPQKNTQVLLPHSVQCCYQYTRNLFATELTTILQCHPENMPEILEAIQRLNIIIHNNIVALITISTPTNPTVSDNHINTTNAIQKYQNLECECNFLIDTISKNLSLEKIQSLIRKRYRKFLQDIDQKSTHDVIQPKENLNIPSSSTFQHTDIQIAGCEYQYNYLSSFFIEIHKKLFQKTNTVDDIQKELYNIKCIQRHTQIINSLLKMEDPYKQQKIKELAQKYQQLDIKCNNLVLQMISIIKQ